jgi:imidazolonepropionase
MRALIDGIGQLVVVPPGPVRGAAMGGLPVVRDAAVVTEGERIAWFGPRGQRPGGDFDEVFDAAGGCVVPGFVDCHTHLVFAGTRENEFVARIRGKTYLEILEAGGGIHVTVEAVRAASEAELTRLAADRLRRMLASGTTTAEVKSGYGLTPADELKMLRVVRRLRAMQPVELVGTYLAAHTVPRAFAGRAEAYLDAMLADPVLETLYASELAEFADVFCERGAFSVPQAERYLRECARHGLRPKLHAEQITNAGATRLGVALGAASVDHLEEIDDESIRLLAGSATVPVLLPGCNFFLNCRPAPARKLIDAGCPVALATDCNPGSSMIESMPLILSTACALLRMTPIEALVAATANAAAAIDRADRVGAIAVGHQADLLVLRTANADQIPYEVGRNPVRLVIKRGRVAHASAA